MFVLFYVIFSIIYRFCHHWIGSKPLRNKVVNLFTFIASEVREILAELGFKSLNEVIGRTDLLHQVSRGSPNLDDLDLNPLLVKTDPGDNARYSESNLINYVPDNNVDEKVWNQIKDELKQNKKMTLNAVAKNTDRAIGTKLSHYIFKKFGENFTSEALNISLEGMFLIVVLKEQIFQYNLTQNSSFLLP